MKIQLDCSKLVKLSVRAKSYVPDINSIILRLAPQAVIPISQRSFSVREGNVAMSTSWDVNRPSEWKERKTKRCCVSIFFKQKEKIE